jgi:large subunit ribosomal protein L29
MRAEEVREMSTDDIKARVAELEEERFRLRFRSATEPLENPLRLRTIRRDIARLKTVLSERAPKDYGTAKRDQTEQSRNG